MYKVGLPISKEVHNTNTWKYTIGNPIRGFDVLVLHSKFAVKIGIFKAYTISKQHNEKTCTIMYMVYQQFLS